MSENSSSPGRFRRIILFVGLSMAILSIVLALTLRLSDPYARYQSAQRSMSAFTAKASIVGPDRKAYALELQVQKPGKLRFDVRGGELDYSVSKDGLDYREMSRGDREYDEIPVEQPLMVYPSRLSDLPRSFYPGFLLVDDLHKLFPKNANVKSERVNGLDQLSSHFVSEEGTSDLLLQIDADGHFKRVKQDIVSQMGQTHLDWHFESIKLSTSSDPLTFHLKFPLGFVPHALPPLEAPVERGKPAPLKNWTNSAGSAVAVSLPSLIVYLDKEAPSQSARAALKTLKSKLKVYVVGEDIFDKSGANTKAFNPAAKPMFYRISNAGKVDRLWIGFDADQSSAWVKEVLTIPGGE